MKIINPLKMSDWDIKKFLYAILYLQCLFWVLIISDGLGVEIPILRQLICVIYLAFVPGLLILRILNIHKLSNIESILYSVGLSISTLMFIGLFINMVYPLFGIDNPISMRYLIFTISLIVLVLSIISYFQDRQYSDPEFIDLSDITNYKFLFLVLIFFLALLGSIFINLYNVHFIHLLLILLVILIAIIIVCSDFFPEKLHPMAIFVSTIALLLSHSLVSNYLRGWDIQYEYYSSNFVIINSFWEFTDFTSNINSCLSIVMMAPILSILSDIDLIYTFKIVYPLLFSLVPIGLYQFYQTQLQNRKLSFLSVFFFISLFVFYEEMLQLARQQIAELYLVLVLLLIFNDSIPKTRKAILSIVFISSVSVSHYGLTYIFIFQLIASISLISLGLKLNLYKDLSKNRISKSFVLLFIVITLSWYIYTSSCSPFATLILIGYQIYSNIFKDFLNPTSTDGLSLVVMHTKSSLQFMSKLVHIIAQLFISIGVLNFLVKYIPARWSREYITLCFVSYALLIASLAIPFFSNAYNTSRIYHITLIFISPLCIIGGIAFLKIVYSLFKVSFNQKCMKKPMRILMVFFTTFMLFNSGFFSDIANNRIFSYTSSDIDTDGPLFNDREVQCANWIFSVRNNSEPVYADEYRCLLLKSKNSKEAFLLPANIRLGTNNSDIIVFDAKDCYLYLGTINISKDIFLISYIKDKSLIRDYLKFDNNFKNKVYSNGGGEIYY